MPAPVQAEAVPVPRAVEPAPAPAQQPWYKRMWGTMSGWFGGGGAKPAQPAPAPQATAPVPASSAPAAGRAEGFAGDAPQRTIRTGAGDCVKTGTWDPSKGEAECPGAETMARAAPAAPMPAPAAQPMPQPVEVQPLPTPQLKEEAALEPEPPSLPPPAPPEPPLAAEPPPAPAEPQMLTLSADALFAVGSYQLKPSARAGLDDLVARLKEVTFQAIKITGHTDPTGSTTLNERLSLQRADEVKRYLVTHGVSATKIETEGMGSSMPMVIERDCAKLPRDKRSACYQPDRRVEIEVTGASEKLAGQ
jgi:OOP family OmpA-OmpF porin